MSNFSIDTCSIITARVEKYPPSVFVKLWENVEAAIRRGEIKAIDVVKAELERNCADSFRWAKTQKQLFTRMNSSIISHANAVLKQAPTLIDASSVVEQADPYVIALALDKSFTVVTEENSKPKKGREKIPTVCKAMNVPVVDFLGMIQEFGWKF
jgi:hypothetical protein